MVIHIFYYQINKEVMITVLWNVMPCSLVDKY